MIDREKVIAEYERFVNNFVSACMSDDYELEMHKAVLDLLKEQENLGTELTNAVELIHKKNERIEKLLKEQEAVEPNEGADPNESHWNCGACGYPLWEDENYCAHCGKPVLWEGR